MGVGDFQVTPQSFKTGSQSGSGVPAGFKGGNFPNMPGAAGAMGSNIGSGVQPMGQPQQNNQPYTGGPVVEVTPTGGVSILGQNVQQQPQSQPYGGRDWYETAGASDRVGPTTNSPPRDWYDTVGGQPAQPPQNSMIDALLAQLGLGEARYQYNVNYAQQDNGLNQQMLALRRQLLGIDANDVGIDKSKNRNQYAGIGTDSDYLRQQRGLYDTILNNQLAQIQSKQGIDLLDHENQYVSGGGWFTPGQKFRKDNINTTADQSRESARLSTQMSQLGIDRSLSQNDVQQRDLDFDMSKLDNRLAANGINMQMLGLNGQQLQLALQKFINDQGISQYTDAMSILSSASQGGSEASDYALQLLMEWLQGGGAGPIPNY